MSLSLPFIIFPTEPHNIDSERETLAQERERERTSLTPSSHITHLTSNRFVRCSQFSGECEWQRKSNQINASGDTEAGRKRENAKAKKGERDKYQICNIILTYIHIISCCMKIDDEIRCTYPITPVATLERYTSPTSQWGAVSRVVKSEDTVLW